MKVQQFYNNNQFIIKGDGSITFQSYDSTIAILEDGHLTLGNNWDYSKTTLKHLYLFISDYNWDKKITDVCNHKNKKAYIQSLIDSGYITVDRRL